MSYFHLANNSYPMSAREFEMRAVQYHGTSAGNVSNMISSPDTVGDVRDWLNRDWMKQPDPPEPKP